MHLKIANVRSVKYTHMCNLHEGTKGFMKKIFLAGAVAAIFVAAPVFAQGYVGFGLGSSSITGFDRTQNGATFAGGNANKTSTKILGGYQITPNWGVEAQYTMLGKRTITVTPVQNGANDNGAEASQFGVYGTGTLPISTDFSLFGKLGLSSNSLRLTDTANASETRRASGISYGFGAGYKITPSIAIRAEYEDFGKLAKDSDVDNISIRGKNLSLSVLYSF